MTADKPEERAGTGEVAPKPSGVNTTVPDTGPEQTPSGTATKPGTSGAGVKATDQKRSTGPVAPTTSTRPGTESAARKGQPPPETRRRTRIGAAWVAIGVAVVVLVLLLIFILENQQQVEVKYFAAQATLPLGVLLLFAAAGGALLVIVLGTARMIQLRWLARRDRRAAKTTP